MTSGRVRLIAVLAICLVSAATAKLLPSATPILLTGSVQIALTLDRPDALIDSGHLSSLPAALIKAPVLKPLLSEEFAFYYEQLDTRLDVNGALKRIAFEHELRLSDRVIDSVFNEPAEVALWRNQGGRTQYWLLNLQRNGLEKILEFLAKAKLDDPQLSLVGQIALTTENSVPLYALKLNNQDTLLLTSHKDRFIVASHPGMLLDENGMLIAERAHILAEMLVSPGDQPSPQARYFASGPRQAEHRISADADLLGFGYGHFLPGLHAVRFEFADTGWSTAIRVDERVVAPLSALPWTAMPMDAAFCVGLPVAKSELAKLIDNLHAGPDVLAGFTGGVTACWYEQDGWQAPLFAARFTDVNAARQAVPTLEKLFAEWIGAREVARQGERFPVRNETGKRGETLWRRQVSARYGDKQVPAELADDFSATRHFDVSLALVGDTVVFSARAERVDQALDTLAHQFPAMHERLPDGRSVLFAIDSTRLGNFLNRATQSALPVDQEPSLRRTADQHLLPRFAALAGDKSLAAALPAKPGIGALSWITLDWLPLK